MPKEPQSSLIDLTREALTRFYIKKGLQGDEIERKIEKQIAFLFPGGRIDAPITQTTAK